MGSLGRIWACHRSTYAPGGMVFHVLNRGVGRRTLFEKEADYEQYR